MARHLTSDHINYLIWRYLQEQGYGKAAIQLQRDWRNDDPQALPFSGPVPHLALVRMLQDGLAYDDLSASNLRRRENAELQETNEDVELPHLLQRQWSFVDVSQQRTPAEAPAPRRLPSADLAEAKRKKQRKEVEDGQGSTSGRRKSIKPPEPTPTNAPDDAMDVDADGEPDDEAMHEAEEVIAKEEPPLPLPHTLEIGQSTGTQSDPVVDKTLAETVATHELPGDIYDVHWSTTDVDDLTVSGGSVCHKLKLSKKAENEEAAEEQQDGLPEASHDISMEPILDFAGSAATYSVGHWEPSPSSQQVAAAIEQLYENGQVEGTVTLLKDGREIRLAETLSSVLALKWDSTSTKLLAIWDSSDGEQSFVTIFDAKEAEIIAQMDAPKKVGHAVWISDTMFACCGQDVLDTYTVDDDDALSHHQSVETDRPWDQLKYDPITGLIVCTSFNVGELGLFDTKEHVLHTKNAHEELITGAEWQPLPEQQGELGDDQMRMLATCCDDGSVKLWNARRALECIHEFTAEHMMPAYAIAFSPDGSLLAAVIGEQVQVYESKVEGRLVAKWTRPKAQEPDNNMLDASSAEDADGQAPMHSLAWNKSESRLALTHSNRVWIIGLPQSEEQTHEQQESIDTTRPP